MATETLVSEEKYLLAFGSVGWAILSGGGGGEKPLECVGERLDESPPAWGHRLREECLWR